jgi:hypothetical protein
MENPIRAALEEGIPHSASVEWIWRLAAACDFADARQCRRSGVTRQYSPINERNLSG